MNYQPTKTNIALYICFNEDANSSPALLRLSHNYHSQDLIASLSYRPKPIGLNQGSIKQLELNKSKLLN